jgi:hypothetical protein
MANETGKPGKPRGPGKVLSKRAYPFLVQNAKS